MYFKKMMSRRRISTLALCSLLFACGGGGTSGFGGAPAPGPIQAPAPAPAPAPAAPAPAPAPTPEPTVPSYFYFSSGHDALTVLTTDKARAALEKYKNVTVGIDAGGHTAAPDFVARVEKMRDQEKWRVQVYLEGPGGPTGEHWAPDECARVKEAAKKYGTQPIADDDDCETDSMEWMKEWNQTGFFKQLQQQLSDLKKLGVYSVEVDNLHRAGYGIEGLPLSDFIVRFNNGKAADNPIRLLLKNVTSSAELDAIFSNSPRSAIADYMIVEEDFKTEWCALRKTGKDHGITTAFSWDTNDYHAEVDSNGKDLVLAGPRQRERKQFAC